MTENEAGTGAVARASSPLKIVEGLGLKPRGTAGREPVILDAGKLRKKAIKSLKSGHGDLIDEVQAIAQEVRAELKEAGTKREVVPLVLIYRQAPRRRTF